MNSNFVRQRIIQINTMISVSAFSDAMTRIGCSIVDLSSGMARLAHIVEELPRLHIPWHWRLWYWLCDRMKSWSHA